MTLTERAEATIGRLVMENMGLVGQIADLNEKLKSVEGEYAACKTAKGDGKDKTVKPDLKSV